MLTISSGLAGLIAALCLPVAISLVVVTLLLLRDLRRADREAKARGIEMERLRDEIWQAHESEERFRSLIEGQNDLILRRDREGRIVYAKACDLGLEGIVSKRLGSHYRSGRPTDWLKFKNPAAPAVKREAEEDWGA